MAIVEKSPEQIALEKRAMQEEIDNMRKKIAERDRYLGPDGKNSRPHVRLPFLEPFPVPEGQEPTSKAREFNYPIAWGDIPAGVHVIKAQVLAHVTKEVVLTGAFVAIGTAAAIGGYYGYKRRRRGGKKK